MKADATHGSYSTAEDEVSTVGRAVCVMCMGPSIISLLNSDTGMGCQLLDTTGKLGRLMSLETRHPKILQH